MFRSINKAENAFKVICDGQTDGQTDGPTDRRTKKWLIESRSTRLKMRKRPQLFFPLHCIRHVKYFLHMYKIDELSLDGQTTSCQHYPLSPHSRNNLILNYYKPEVSLSLELKLVYVITHPLNLQRPVKIMHILSYFASSLLINSSCQ